MNLYQQDIFGGEVQIPFVRGSRTSAAAARSVMDQVDTARQLVLQLLFKQGPLTDEEIAAHLGMNPNTARPRRIELERAGCIYKVGMKKTRSGRQANKYAALRTWEEAMKKGARRARKEERQ